MTNEEIVQKIQEGQTELMLDLWLQTKGFINKVAYSFSCVQFANKCVSAGLTKEDLINESYFALDEAVKSYKTDKGANFISYLSLHLKKRFYKLLGIQNSGGKWYNRADILSKAESMDKIIDDDSATTLENFIPDKSAEEKMYTIEMTDYIENLHADLETALNSLKTQEAQVIKNYYYNGISLSKQAKILNCSTTSITNIKNKALFALRRHKVLQAYKTELIDKMAYHTSLSNFRNTKTSSVEKIVLKLDTYERELKKYEAKLFKADIH